jgi:uncharacterized protein
MGSSKSDSESQEAQGRLRRCGDGLDDEQAVTIREDAEGEERYVTIGMDALGDVLVVVYTWRGDRPRLISARKAEPKEREHYGSKS